jgi:hypothetical protein
MGPLIAWCSPAYTDLVSVCFRASCHPTILLSPQFVIGNIKTSLQVVSPKRPRHVVVQEIVAPLPFQCAGLLATAVDTEGHDAEVQVLDTRFIGYHIQNIPFFQGANAQLILILFVCWLFSLVISVHRRTPPSTCSKARARKCVLINA